MAIFGGGIMRDARTGRPVAGKVLRVVNPSTGATVPTVTTVSTDAGGYYPDFTTTSGPDVVRLEAGDRIDHAVAIGKAVTYADLVADGNGYLDLPGGA